MMTTEEWNDLTAGEPRAPELDTVTVLREEVASCAAQMKREGFYMPALATLLRGLADEYADKFPDDTNGGRR